MKLAVATPGRFHSFDLAAELEAAGALGQIFTGYPRFKLRGERVSPDRIVSISGLHAPLMASLRLPLQAWLAPLQAHLYEVAREAMDRRVSRELDGCDGLIALSGSGLASGREMRRRGGIYVCDRGSTHILFQDRILREEAGIVGLRPRPIHPRAIERELAEYALADAILTPSHFTRRSFIAEGVPAEKLWLAPYGVNTAAFRPGPPKAGRFTVLFAGQTTYRKGLHYLFKAWRDWAPAGVELRIAGGRSAEFDQLVRWAGGLPAGVVLLGHLDRPTLAAEMSAAHALVMPSIEEGLPLVMAQAMACGAPVIATENAGAETLFEHGKAGLIGPARSPDFLAASFETLASDRALAEAMSQAAIARSAEFGAARAYGERVMAALQAIYAGESACA